VHPDLVELAGGADVVAARAAERLTAGTPVEAVHLAEAALHASPANLAALEVMVSAHEMLEENSENFWLTQWLRKQLGDLRATLEAASKEGEA
jgi:alkyl sulfatase BDS1-like metallo-beta-lactamase superfamily hydrolase